MATLNSIVFLLVLAVAQGRMIQHANHTRIINGQDSSYGEIPYQVSIQINDFSILRHYCGGTILNENYVLTAAHCLENLRPGILTVFAGTIHLNQPQAVHWALSRRIHENYNQSNSWINDIALLKVFPSFRFNKNVLPVRLPKYNAHDNAGEIAVVSGWGSTKSGSNSNTLQKVEVKIADQQYCRNAYVNKYTIHDTQICAHDPIEEHGSCQGDSGGPLTVDGILVGIVSWATGCSQVNYPTVFTRVSSYIDWIQKYSV